MSDNKKVPGYVPLTYHGLEHPKLHNKPIVPYHKFMPLEERIKKCKENFGTKKQFEKGQGN